jgi:hypothetical protein
MSMTIPGLGHVGNADPRVPISVPRTNRSRSSMMDRFTVHSSWFTDKKGSQSTVDGSQITTSKRRLLVIMLQQDDGGGDATEGHDREERVGPVAGPPTSLVLPAVRGLLPPPPLRVYRPESRVTGVRGHR